MTRNLQAAIAVGIVCLFLGAMWLGSDGYVRKFAFISFVLSILMWGIIWFPEGLVSAYFFAGRVNDPRLQFEELPLSVNQMLFIAIVYLLVVHRDRLFVSMRLWSVRGLLSWVVWLSLALLWSMGPDYGEQKVIRHVVVVLPSLACFVALVLWRGHLYFAIVSLWGLGLGLTALGLFKLLTTAEVEQLGRLSVLGGGPNIFARLVGMGLLFSLVAFATLWTRQSRKGVETVKLRARLPLLLGATALVLMAAPSFVLAQSRGPAVSLIVALAVFALLLSRAGLGKIVVVATLAALGVWLAVFTLEASGMGSRFDPSRPDNLGTFEARQDLAAATLDIIVEYPRVGVGTGGWPVAMYGIDRRMYPHNFFVEIAAEQGVLACALVLLLFAVQTIVSVRVYLQSSPSIEREVLLACIVVFVYIVMTAQVSGDVLDNRHVWVCLILMELARRRVHMGPGFGVLRPLYG